MDFFTHAASGALLGAGIGAVWRPAGLTRGKMVLVTTVAGVLPDLDALTNGLGEWGRRAYLENRWYSHHQASHSFLGCLVLALCTGLLWSAARRRRSPDARRGGTAVALLVFLGSVVHLLLDLPTPRGPWGGLPLLYPSPRRFGGWGLVWWWHNYFALFVLLTALALVGLLALAASRARSFRRLSTGLQPVVALVAFGSLAAYCARSGFEPGRTWYESDARAREIQRKWLPAPVHAAFVKASEVLPIEL